MDGMKADRSVLKDKKERDFSMNGSSPYTAAVRAATVDKV
jgi:hypothetical protein